MFDKLFLGIGAMKAGTTWTYALLESHPQLQFTPEKEVHFLAQHYLGREYLSQNFRRQRMTSRLRGISHLSEARQQATRQWYEDVYLPGPVNIAWYENLFAGGRKRNAWRCDFSNLSALIPAEGWSRMRLEIAQDVRALYVLREPVERLWSHYKFHATVAKRSFDPNPDAVAIEAFLSGPDVMRHARYSETIANVRQGLGPERLLVLFHDQMREDPPGFLASIENFLEVQPRSYEENPGLRRLVNATSDEPVPPLFRTVVKDALASELKALATTDLALPPAWL